VFIQTSSQNMKSAKALVLSFAVSMAGVANAGGVQTWGHVSDALAVGLPLLAAGTAFGKGDSQGVKELTYSLGATLAATTALKSLIHEQRPDGSGNDSFPSGHTAIAFAAARFIDKRYAPEASPYLYAAAGLTALARVKADKHYTKDVLVGAALGYASAEYFTRPIAGGAVSLMPGKSGFAVVWQKPLF
jgi:membrane-associated phospholipid phosphatase